jgi:inner membrane protein
VIISTHITFAEFIYLLVLTTTGVVLNTTNAIIIAFASVLPDIDTAASVIGKICPFISKPLERRFGHRTLTHSLMMIVIIAVAGIPIYILKQDIYICSIIGYASHPLLDTATINGVKLFYPFSKVKCVFPMEVNHPHSYRMQTGSKIDLMLSVIFFIGCVPTFIIASQGYERFIRTTQQNIEAAVRDYNEYSKDYLVFADVQAYDMFTKRPLVGIFEIVGALDPQTLIFKGQDSHLHTLGKDFQADYVAEKILCQKGNPAFASIRNLDVSNQILIQMLSLIDTTAENYFFGDLIVMDKVAVPDNIKLFSPVTGSSNTIKFNYASVEDILTYNLESVFISKGILTIKTVTKRDTVATEASSIPVYPKMENYAQLSIVLDPKETITFLKQKGDTLKEKEIIAQKNSAQFFLDQVNLNEEKILSIQQQSNASINALDQKIANAEETFRIDSMTYRQNSQLSSNGYVSSNNLEAAKLKFQKDRLLLSQLASSKLTEVSKSRLEIHKLRLSNVQLKARAKAAELQSEVRSTVHGVLIDVRQILHNNKTQVTFIVKKLN